MGFSDGDASKGASLFKTRCAQCHTVENGGGECPSYRQAFSRSSGQKLALSELYSTWNTLLMGPFTLP